MTARDDNARTRAAMQRRAAERGGSRADGPLYGAAVMPELPEPCGHSGNSHGMPGHQCCEHCPAPLPPSLAEWLAEARRLGGQGTREAKPHLLLHLDALPARVAEYVQETLAALREGQR